MQAAVAVVAADFARVHFTVVYTARIGRAWHGPVLDQREIGAGADSYCLPTNARVSAALRSAGR